MLGSCYLAPRVNIPLVIGPGAPAPDFELPDQDGEHVRLSSLRGRWVVVYFYPKADTPGRISRLGRRGYKRSPELRPFPDARTGALLVA